MTDHPDLVGVAEAARITGLSPRGVRKAHERGKMPSAIPVAGSDVLVWDRSEVEAWARKRITLHKPDPRPTTVACIEDQAGDPIDVTGWTLVDPTGNVDLEVESPEDGAVRVRARWTADTPDGIPPFRIEQTAPERRLLYERRVHVEMDPETGMWEVR